MIGALIGDLAAWTYENDRETFFLRLLPKDSDLPVPSCYSEALLKAASCHVLRCPNINEQIFGTYHDGIHFFGQWLIRQLLPAWDFDIPEVVYMFDLDNGEYLAQRFVIDLIRLLRNGASKSEAYHTVDKFEECSKSLDWRHEFNPKFQLDVVTVVLRAWNAFYLGFDFTSTIHNAVKWKEERHLVTMLAASFADAMYGCQYSFIKRKFAKHDHFYCTISPNSYAERHGYHHGLIHELACISDERRSFFPKNCSLTNVEWHQWQEIHFQFGKILFSEDDRQRIMRAGHTGWDNRFGIYLDDGWFYCYRSHFLLIRFKLEKQEGTNTYNMTHLQLSGEKDVRSCISGLCCALQETCRVHSPSILHECANMFDYCLYFKSEADSSHELSSEERVFLFMERQYYTQRYLEPEQRRIWEHEALTACMQDENLTEFMKNDSIPLCVKGMIAFSIADLYYHSPMADGKIVYAYAQIIADKYSSL